MPVIETPGQPDQLPVLEILPQLNAALYNHNRCLLVAQPGAGKTTRVPLELLRQTPQLPGKWLLLEPRRAAARQAADYMATACGEAVGKTVGYRVRGESKTGPDTRLEVVTQGILTRILQDNPLLEGVQGIIFDEFHERSLDADLGLALALDVQGSLREDLKLLVMSATLDVERLLNTLGEDTPVIDCPGRAWPVETLYRPCPPRETVEAHQARVVREVLTSHSGDLLVFLPGQREINRLFSRLEATVPADIQLERLYGRLSLAAQRAVLRPQSGPRRVILSTDVAESSVTVPGVRIVIDAGMERAPVYSPRSGLTRLDTRRVNRASADQRRGRAGREAPGACYRLWSEELPLRPHREPEIQQSELSALAYELLRWGVADTDSLAWVSPVPEPAFASAMQLLQTLKIVDSNRKLTAWGKRCARWPTHPRLAVLLEYATQNALESLACWLVAFMEENPPANDIDLAILLQHRQHRDADGKMSRWREAARQWSRRLGCSTNMGSDEAAATLMAVAYPDRLAQRRGNGKFRLVGGGQAVMPESHRLAKSDYLVIPDLDGKAENGKIYTAIAISKAAVESLFPETRQWRIESEWDTVNGRLVTEQVRRIGAVELGRRPGGRPDPDAVRNALLNAVRQRGYLKWSDSDRQLLGRLQLLHKTLGDPWPDVSAATLMNSLETWLAPHLTGVSRLDQLDSLQPGRFLLQSMDWPLQRQLEELAPVHYRAPSGSNIRIDYSGGEPVLAVKLQEMFGQTVTPTIAGGRIALTLHLLSPARRPVQVTRDLINFWQTTYFEVRKDLKGRYPKHPWPDNPLEAQATRHTRRRQ